MAPQGITRFIVTIVILGPSKCYGFGQNTSFRDTILASAAMHCPNVDYCGRKHTIDTTLTDNELERPCCTACDCNNDCNSSSACCFPANGIQHGPPLHSCYRPRTAGDEQYSTLYMEYYMVDQCPDKGRQTVQCGDTKVAPWGAMMPVYSKSQGKIYKNMVCAKCHDVDDAEVWLSNVICKAHIWVPGVATSIVASVEVLRRGILSNDCHVTFIPPEAVDISDIVSHECLNVKISKCSHGLAFYMPQWSTLTRNKVIHLCESDFWSPYIRNGINKNIFCFLCNNNVTAITHTGVCSRFPFSAKDLGLGQFNGLINILSLNEFFHDDETGDETAKQLVTCKISDATVCRQVFCPVGQLYNRKRICAFPFVDWNSSPYNLHLTLITRDKIRMSKKSPNVSLPEYDIVSPLPKHWVLQALYYQLHENTSEFDNDIMQFIVYYKRTKPVHNAPALLRTIHKLMKNDWVVSSRGYKYTCSAKFSRNYIYWYVHKSDTMIPYWKNHIRHSDNSSLTIPHDTGIIVPIVRTIEPTTGFNINRLNYCSQIQLQKNEYSTNIRSVVRDINSKTYFFGNEYIEILDDNGEPVIRVCQEDLGYSMRVSGVAVTMKIDATDLLLVAAIVGALVHLGM